MSQKMLQIKYAVVKEWFVASVQNISATNNVDCKKYITIEKYCTHFI